MDAERFRHTNIPAPPAGATVALRPAGFVASVSTRDPRAWILLLFFVVFGGGVAGGLYGSQIVSGKWDFLESMLGLPLLAGDLRFGGLLDEAGRGDLIAVIRAGMRG